VRGLAVPVLLWALFVAVLGNTLRLRMHRGEEYDEDALREWVQESRIFRDTLPETIRDYLDAADPAKGLTHQLPVVGQEIAEQLRALGVPTQMYQTQLPLFPTIYRLELDFPKNPGLVPIVWDSGIPRPSHTSQVRRLADPILGPSDDRALLHIEYQMHAYNK